MRYVLVGLGALVAIVGVIAVVGWSLPVRHRASAERTYRASPTDLFALINDVDGFPSWRAEVRRTETLPEQNGHRRWVETTKNGPPITYVVEQMIPDQLLVGRIANTDLPFGGSWTYELRPVGHGATSLRITENGEVYNPIFRFVSRFVMGHDATITQYLTSVEKRFPPVATNGTTR